MVESLASEDEYESGYPGYMVRGKESEGIEVYAHSGV